MNKVPDTITGAFLISAIDFILSFAIIGGIGLVLAALPIVNRFWTVDEKNLRGGH